MKQHIRGESPISIDGKFEAIPPAVHIHWLDLSEKYYHLANNGGLSYLGLYGCRGSVAILGAVGSSLPDQPFKAGGVEVIHVMPGPETLESMRDMYTGSLRLAGTSDALKLLIDAHTIAVTHEIEDDTEIPLSSLVMLPGEECATCEHRDRTPCFCRQRQNSRT